MANDDAEREREHQERDAAEEREMRERSEA